MATRKLGLALGGGGVKGIAHLGVLAELERAGVAFDVIAGTSIGAIVGAMAAAGVPLSAAEEAFRATPVRRLLGFDPERWGLIGAGKLAEILYGLLGDRRIEELPIAYAAVAVDLVTGREVTLSRGSLVEAALASAAVPGIFPPNRGEEQILVDGGIRNNLPVDVARRLGAERVVAVDLFGEFNAWQVDDPGQAGWLSLRRWAPLAQLELAERAINIMLHEMTVARLRDTPPDLLISPEVHAISMAEISLPDPGIEAGAAAVRPYLAELDALRRWRLGQEAGLNESIELS